MYWDDDHIYIYTHRRMDGIQKQWKEDWLITFTNAHNSFSGLRRGAMNSPSLFVGSVYVIFIISVQGEHQKYMRKKKNLAITTSKRQ